jgi:predicted PhzF superfamily epimerase YddE/YHI9/RimJ/RimL family protein N-acetyltransferase
MHSSLKTQGNPSTVFIGDYAKDEMSKLAIETRTPISCFVKVMETEAHVTFFAQNGEEDGFCGHGLISVIKHLKENNLGYINTLVSASGVRLTAKVLENGMSSLEIPVSKFNISPWNLPDFTNFFNLSKQDVVEIFRTNPLGDIAVEISSPEALKNITLDAKKVDEFSKEHNIRIMVFFCKGSSFEIANVEIRVFCSKLYDLEDIVCGSANISVSNVMFNKYGISKYKVIQPFNFKTTGKIGGYQELEYNNEKKILTLNGFAKIAKKERFIFEPLDIVFDEAYNPISRNKDYYFLRSILTDIEVMKTSTVYGCGLAETEKDLHNTMNFLIAKNNIFGTRKVFDCETSEYIGIASLLEAGEFLEYGVLLKTEFTGKGFGSEILSRLIKIAEMESRDIICSIWENNYPSIKIAEKNGMVFDSQISKIYKGKIINVNTYKKNKTTIDFQSFLLTRKIA